MEPIFESPPPAAAEDAIASPVMPADAMADADRGSGFGTLLEPVVRRACGDRLCAVNWFRTDWQRGGALTGYARFTNEAGQDRPVVVKLPVPPCERRWLVHLHEFDDVAPRIYAHGESLNGYDLAWVVMERLPHGPLGQAWGGREFDLLVEAVVRFYVAAESVPRRAQPPTRDWSALLARARQRAADGAVPQAQPWNRALKKARRRLKDWTGLWEGRRDDGWCHGDLHLGNAMTRAAAPRGPALLFDFARTHVGHWVQDAVYLEHLFWSRPERLAGRRLCRQIAQQRKAMGLPVDRDWVQVAQTYRALLALATPATLEHDGDPRHVQAALAVLEHAVG